MDNNNNNCIINKVNNTTADLTLQDIGDIFGITRMRICQIEKQTLNKLSKKSLLS
jgi:DNA-directed RNA polymerase sigma subunit (sigma70/sigma32)